MQTVFHGALLGKSLGHSFSQRFFNAWFAKIQQTDFSYSNWELVEMNLWPEKCKQHPATFAWNVTIPYKSEILPYLQQIDPDAQAIGAVNTVVRTPEQQLIGYNTDWIGFRDALMDYLEPQHNSALVFGTGGASKAVSYALQQLGIACTLVSRNSNENVLTYEDLTPELAYTHTLWINTTPIGTYPNVDEKLDLPYEVLDGRFLLFDLVYNPEQTAFLQAGLAQGAHISNGYAMLVNQARAAWKIWQKHYPDLPNME